MTGTTDRARGTEPARDKAGTSANGGHELRFWGLPNAAIRAACGCGRWSVALSGGHTLTELTRLAGQHGQAESRQLAEQAQDGTP